MDEPRIERVDPSDIRPGPIRHESLPPELLERIEAIHGILGPNLGSTLEQFEIGFMRDMNPESEVAIWCSITLAWQSFHEKHLDDQLLPDEQEQKIVAALIAISTGVAEPDRLPVPPEIGRQLIECYDELRRR
jgi:hypothetical protein